MIGKRLGDQLVTAKLGRGGMGAVYRTLDVRTNTPMAIKVLADSLSTDPQLLKRFELEQEIVARLEHPRIVRGQGGVRCVDGTYFFLMEYVAGSNLSVVLRALGRLTPAEAVRVGLQTCEALAFAHAQGVVHRDLKPSNLLIDAAADVHVTDFGLAKVAELTRLTLTGQVLGTPEYMSPEQAEGRPTEERTDLYSFGVTLFEMVAGRLPFHADNPLAVLRKHVEEAPPPPSRFAPDVPPSLEAAILRCLEKDPTRRFEGAAALGEALRTALPPRPTGSPPEDPRVRILELVAAQSMKDTLPYVTAPDTHLPSNEPSAKPPPSPRRPSGLRVGLALLFALAVAAAVVRTVLAPASRGRAPDPVSDAPASAPESAAGQQPEEGEPPEDSPPVEPRTAEVTLANGQKFTAKVLTLDGEGLTVRKEDGSEATWPIEEVRSFKYLRERSR